jgi:voltage-gated potassium channel
MSGDHRSAIDRLKDQRFLILLVLLLSYIILTPLYEDSPGWLPLRATLQSLVFLAAIACLQFKKITFVVFKWFGILTLVSAWVPLAAKLPVFFITSDAFRILFFAGVTVVLIYQIAASETVSFDTILGAIDGYLLLGFMGAAAFGICEMASPGSFRFPDAARSATDFVYFGFITMTTVGYGDITPVAPAARSIAILVAVSGQLYIAILISLLVGKYISTRSPAPPFQ